MDTVDAAKPEGVYCLEVDFRWNGQALRAGRTPIYGMEAPSKDMERGARIKGKEVYQLSPLPFQFPMSMESRSNGIEFDPAFPDGKGELEIRIRITSDSNAFAQWLRKGTRKGQGGLSDGLDEMTRKWRPILTGNEPGGMRILFRKTAIDYRDSGDIRNTRSIGEAELSVQKPLRFLIAMDPLGSRLEEYQMEFPQFTLLWERRKDPLPLWWPNEGPESGSEPSAVKAPHQATPPSGKPPFWKFWIKGE